MHNWIRTVSVDLHCSLSIAINDRKQRVKANGSFSTWTKTTLGVPQDLVREPLLFNVYLNDLFMLLEEARTCYYADKVADTVITCLERYGLKMTEWFPNSYMKPNEDKCHLMIYGVKRDNRFIINMGEACVKESTEENLLSIAFDKSLSFREYAKILCRKVGQKLHVAARISPSTWKMENCSS